MRADLLEEKVCCDKCEPEYVLTQTTPICTCKCHEENEDDEYPRA